MAEDSWKSVDRYIAETLVREDPALLAAQSDAAAAGLPAISVSAAQGKLLHILAKVLGAARVLEIGTLAGYSTIWLARALPAHGTVVTIEYDPKHAAVARSNIDRAGLGAKVDILVGRAIDQLPRLDAPGRKPFDMIFIDADKQSTPQYFEWSLRLIRGGGLIVVDNVVRSGRVIEPASGDPSIEGIRRFNEMVAASANVSATAIQTVGSKGYDGFALVRVNDPAGG